MMAKVKSSPPMFFGGMLLWYLLIQFVFSLYRTTEFVSQRASGNISFVEEMFHSLLLFLPFLIVAVIVMKGGAGRLCIAEMRDMIWRYRYGYLFYVLALLFLHFNFMEGILYMDGRWIGPAIWLDRSMTSYVVMAFCHLVFGEFRSVLYLAMAPLLCQAVKVEKGRGVHMFKKRYRLLFISIIVLSVAMVFSGCVNKLEEPVFVKNLVCSSDMDAEIEIITDDDFKLKPIGMEIPDMPEELHLDFYDETVDHYRGYDLHCLNFGIAADDLNESVGLKEDFIFHEVIVKWDDGSQTKADIGTIHMTAGMEYDLTFDWKSREDTFPDKNTIEVVQEHHASEDLVITKIEVPYMDKLPGLGEMVLDGRDVSEITEDDPLTVEKGKTYFLNYTIDTSVSTGYRVVFLEYRIIGIDKHGKEKIVGSYMIQGNDNREMPEWIYEQIEEAEQT